MRSNNVFGLGGGNSGRMWWVENFNGYFAATLRPTPEISN